MKSLLIATLMTIALAACGQSGTPSANADNPYQTATFETQNIEVLTLDYTPAQNKQIFYYNAKGHRSDEPESNGYYREVLGQMADGRTVVQDFYQASAKPQTSPFPIMKNGDVSQFDGSVIDGRVIRYQADGNVTSVAHYQNGKQQGWLNVYEFNRLVAQLRDHGDNGFDVRFFSPEDKTWGEAYIYSSNVGKLDLRELVLYRANGKILTTMQHGQNGAENTIITYDENGKASSDVAVNSQLNETLLRRFASVIQKLPTLMAR